MGAAFSIVSWSARGSAEMAANVSAMSVNRSACVRATGAACADARPICRKNWSSSVFGSARFVMTGVSARKNGLSASIERLIDCPRPAKASPNPAVAFWMCGRVAGSKVENRSSNSSGSEAFFTGIVSPDVKVRLLVPGWSSTYLSPSAERGRTRSFVSTPSGSTFLSRARSASAMARRWPFTVLTVGVISFTTPTRKPPTRTSLPFTSLAPEGSSAFRS